MRSGHFRVAAFTGGETVPSARFRVRQYVTGLKIEGIDMVEHAAIFGCYPPLAKWQRPMWAPLTLASRVPSIIKSFRYQLTLLQREMLSTFFTIENWTRRPRVLDVDDAIWVRRNGNCARRLAECCDAIICGNDFLASRFRSWNRNIYILPTAVDTDIYIPVGSARSGEVIGWSGTSSGFRHLYAIEEALNKILLNRPSATVLIVSDRPPSFRRLPPDRVRFIRWTPRAEVSALHHMNVGIMPLENDEWTKGKCSFKMLTYMACGLPVIVSPVGMNVDVLRRGPCGFAAEKDSDWVDGINTVLADPIRAGEMGAVGRQIVEQHFSLRFLTPRLAEILRTFA